MDDLLVCLKILQRKWLDLSSPTKLSIRPPSFSKRNKKILFLKFINIHNLLFLIFPPSFFSLSFPITSPTTRSLFIVPGVCPATEPHWHRLFQPYIIQSPAGPHNNLPVQFLSLCCCLQTPRRTSLLLPFPPLPYSCLNPFLALKGLLKFCDSPPTGLVYIDLPSHTFFSTSL